VLCCYGFQIFKEDVFDLLDANQAAVRLDAGSMAKASAPGRVPIQIRETATGGITLAGVTEAEVKSKEEMASYLTRGSSSRATASTNMNRQSRYAVHHTCVFFLQGPLVQSTLLFCLFTIFAVHSNKVLTFLFGRCCLSVVALMPSLQYALNKREQLVHLTSQAAVIMI
jgi:hypothetical protein